MNDVSILFPLPSTADGSSDLLAPSASGARGPLLPSALYSTVGPITGSTPFSPPDGGSFELVAAYADLRVVAMRLDPCFASLAPDPHGVGCTAQLRLILQEVRAPSSGSGAPQAFDSALHVFYSLTRQELLDLGRALVALRVANANGASLGPLAPHPIMVSQGLGGAMTQGVEALILQYAGVQNLIHTAQLSSTLNELGSSWTMSAFDVANAGTTVTAFAIPTLVQDAGAVALQTVSSRVANPGSFSGADFEPATTSADNLTPLDDGMPTALGTSQVQAAFDSLVRIENPRDDSPNTIDCASCHVVTLTEDLVAMPLFSLDDTTSALAFVPDGKTVLAADMIPTAGTGAAESIDIHAFSYIGQSPNINQRVVNETAAVVEYLNDLPQ